MEFLKGLISCFLLVFCLTIAQAQQSAAPLDSLVTQAEVDSVLRELKTPEAKRQTFANLYSEYLKKHRKSFRCSFLTLSNLARATDGTQTSEAFDCLNTLFVSREAELQLKETYFERIAREVGAGAALQFLQHEERRNLQVLAALYRVGYGDNSLEALRQADGLTGLHIRELLVQYEQEVTLLLGKKLSDYEKCFEQPGGMSAGQCRKIGSEFIKMQKIEALIQEKYFSEAVKTMGTDIAARFIGIQDYSAVCAKLDMLAGTGSVNR